MHTASHRARRQSGSSTLGFLLLGLSLAAGLVIAAAVVSSSLERIKLAGDKITVKGYAEEKVVSDAGTWRATLTVRAADLQSGYRKLEADTARVLALLMGVAGESAAVAVSPVNARPQYEVGPGGVQTGRIAGYELDRNFELSSGDVALIGTVADKRFASRYFSCSIERNTHAHTNCHIYTDSHTDFDPDPNLDANNYPQPDTNPNIDIHSNRDTQAHQKTEEEKSSRRAVQVPGSPFRSRSGSALDRCRLKLATCVCLPG